MTDELFREDARLAECEAGVVSVGDEGIAAGVPCPWVRDVWPLGVCPPGTVRSRL